MRLTARRIFCCRQPPWTALAMTGAAFRSIALRVPVYVLPAPSPRSYPIAEIVRGVDS
jgi:hypothetical protein